MIEINYEYDKVNKDLVDESWTYNISQMILEENGHNEAQITIIFSNDLQLYKLKKTYFNLDVLTDTITFNLEEKNEPIEGEIYISLERVIENAKTYKQSSINELQRVIIHSVLHLLGFKDETPNDKIIMTELEEKYLSYNIKSTLYK